MPTIKPAQFPHINRESVQRPENSRPVKPQESTKNQSIAKIKKAAQDSRQQVTSKSADEIKISKEQKLEKAIEVLREKSIQLYHPDRSKARQPAELGQIIDVKV